MARLDAVELKAELNRQNGALISSHIVEIEKKLSLVMAEQEEQRQLIERLTSLTNELHRKNTFDPGARL